MIEERLAELGIELPPAPQPVASYIPVKVVGGFAWVAGQVPMQDGAITVSGAVGSDVTTEEANAGARRCAIQALSALRAALGSLDRVTGILQVTVFIAADPEFIEHPRVANGASDLLILRSSDRTGGMRGRPWASRRCRSVRASRIDGDGRSLRVGHRGRTRTGSFRIQMVNPWVAQVALSTGDASVGRTIPRAAPRTSGWSPRASRNALTVMPPSCRPPPRWLPPAR